MVLSVLKEVIYEILKFQPSSNGYTFQIEVNNFVESKILKLKKYQSHSLKENQEYQR